ncbi:MAG: GntR family transcriptional regulator [Edaphobacter sp.]|uniref:GntR family transcriptional regulator n=1 Tax=Edaphobacter sp. TaxID=1934404 RepID=UPI00238C22E2|nr:GntR family transcriptional regulator [Edaphobacter sp.]MDE1177923.1 GntR family transcriptional regulator [Edaphobacter sp.]
MEIARGTSLAHQAYLMTREKILRGEIPMGGVLSRRHLAAEFSMSFVPITEALQRLEDEGLLESRPRVGTRVKIPTPNDVRERYIMREALETQSARLFCERANPVEREGLLEMAERLDQESQIVSCDPKEQYGFQSFHLQFHMQIALWAGSTLLCENLEKNQVLVFNWLFDINAHSRMPEGWHGELAKVLTGKDPDDAALAMGRHIRSGMGEIQEAISKRFSMNLPPIGRISQTRSSKDRRTAKTAKPTGKKTSAITSPAVKTSKKRKTAR